MTTSAHLRTTSGNSLPASLYQLKGSNIPQVLRMEKPSDEAIWQNFLAANRILHHFRPDYFMIYKFTKSTILYQHNINLDLGIKDVNLDTIMNYLAPEDLNHIRSMDKIMCQMTT